MSMKEVSNDQKGKTNYENMEIEVLVKQNKSLFNELQWLKALISTKNEETSAFQ